MHTIESWHGLEPFAEVWDDREEQVPGVWCRGNLRLVPKSAPRGVCYLPTRSTLPFNLNACPKKPRPADPTCTHPLTMPPYPPLQSAHPVSPADSPLHALAL